MIRGFVVVLLCLSGVYCISSTIENLDFNGLNRILNGQTAINEWNTALDQKVTYHHPDGRKKTTVDVRLNALSFRQYVNNSPESFEWLHTIIKTAYQCTLTKYGNLTIWLVFQELWQFKTNVFEAIRYTQLYSSNPDLETIFANDLFRAKLLLLDYGKYDLDYDFKINGDFQLYNRHVVHSTADSDMHYFWTSMIEKAVGLKIKYKVYTDVMVTKFRNEYKQPLVATLNELACVLNESIKIFDNFIVENCVQHGGKFVKNFQSLKNGVKGDFMSVLKKFDDQNTEHANVELYRDFTQSIPGTWPTTDAMRVEASGCFVENLELEISGFKMNLPNFDSPTAIYGNRFHERTSEITMKLVQSNDLWQNQSDSVKIGMILFQNEANSSGDHSQPGGPIP